MDFLVPDEEKWFHWVLRDHLMEGDSNRPRTHGPLQKHFGFQQLDTITKKVLLKIVPTLSRSPKRAAGAPASRLNANANARHHPAAGTCLEKDELVTSESSSAMTTEQNLEPEVETAQWRHG